MNDVWGDLASAGVVPSEIIQSRVDLSAYSSAQMRAVVAPLLRQFDVRGTEYGLLEDFCETHNGNFNFVGSNIVKAEDSQSAVSITDIVDMELILSALSIRLLPALIPAYSENYSHRGCQISNVPGIGALEEDVRVLTGAAQMATWQMITAYEDTIEERLQNAESPMPRTCRSEQQTQTNRPRAQSSEQTRRHRPR